MVEAEMVDRGPSMLPEADDPPVVLKPLQRAQHRAAGELGAPRQGVKPHIGSLAGFEIGKGRQAAQDMLVDGHPKARRPGDAFRDRRVAVGHSSSAAKADARRAQQIRTKNKLAKDARRALFSSEKL